MSQAYGYPYYPTLEAARERTALWQLADAVLLFLVVAAAGEMLGSLGAIQSLAWLICYGLAMLRIAMSWQSFWPVLRGNVVMLLYPAVCISSVVWSRARFESFEIGIELLISVMISIYLGWRYSPLALLRVLALTISVSVVLSLLHWATGIFPWPIYRESGGLAGFYTHKNMLGEKALIGIVAILGLLGERNVLGPFARLAFATVIGLSFVALALSQAMTSVLLTPVAIGGLALICLRRLPPTMTLVLLIGGMLMLTVVPVVMAALALNPATIILDSVGKSATLTGRTILWEVARETIAEYPVFGVGFGAFRLAPEFANQTLFLIHTGALNTVAFHNFILEIGVSTGLLGICAIFVMILSSVARMRKLHRIRGGFVTGAALIILIGAVVTSSIGTTLYRGHELLLMLVVIFGVSAREELRRG